MIGQNMVFKAEIIFLTIFEMPIKIWVHISAVYSLTNDIHVLHE